MEGWNWKIQFSNTVTFVTGIDLTFRAGVTNQGPDFFGTDNLAAGHSNKNHKKHKSYYLMFLVFFGIQSQAGLDSLGRGLNRGLNQMHTLESTSSKAIH